MTPFQTTALRIALCVYMLGVVISMRVFVERDPKKRSPHDVEISAVMSLGWPIVIVLACTIVTYLIANKLPPFDDLKKKKEKKK